MYTRARPHERGAEVFLVADDTDRRAEGDRRAQRRFRFLDRRTGFDRRRSYPFLGTLRDSRWLLLGVLVLLNFFSLLDGLLTAGEIWLGVAREDNPLFGAILLSNPLAAAAFKVSVMVLVSVSIWRWRSYRMVTAMAIVALAAYAGVLAYHFGSLRGLGVI